MIGPHDVEVEVPHGGTGTHTLLVAVEVDDEVLADPLRYHRLARVVAAMATKALREHHEETK